MPTTGEKLAMKNMPLNYMAVFVWFISGSFGPYGEKTIHKWDIALICLIYTVYIQSNVITFMHNHSKSQISF